MSRKAPRYEIQHASGRITTTSAALWSAHVEAGDLIRLARRRALVALHLACWEQNGKLVFVERNEHGFSGDTPIASQWAAIMRAWLLKGPFPELMDLDHVIKTRQVTTIEAYHLALDEGAKG